MALTPGTRLGPYEIIAQLGVGGMGEVYRARDTKLDRQVAIKVLPEAFAQDAERLTRFEREARTLAALNHPNIAQIHGLEEADGIRALVMELVEGPTLADRIAQGAVPVDEALPIAKQIAEALEAAHDQGIIHRDLKPANVKVRPDGTVKVLDFGLAKAMEPTSAMSPSMSQSPTITTPAMTQAGMILGTAAYMSPEQARGKPVDKRADIWAFGCVLYEMMTGKQAFEGGDVTDTLANVLKREPDWNVLPTEVSPTLGVWLKRCLEKDAGQRVPDVGAVRLALEGAFEIAVPQDAKGPTVAQPAWKQLLSVAVVALLLGVLVAGLTTWSLWPRPPASGVTRFHYDLPSGQVFRSMGFPVMALSPDGNHFVYNTLDGLYLRSMETLEARLVPGTESPFQNPFFSPDGQTLGYYDPSTDQLMRMEVSGGAPVALARIGPRPWGSSWASDDTIFWGSSEGILRVPATGGTPELVIPARDGEQVYGPQLLPDGDSVLFSLTTSLGDTRWDESQVVVQSLSTGERTLVLRGGSDARYLPAGYLVYALGDSLFGVAFDSETRAVRGEAVTLVQGVMRASSTGGVAQSGVAHYSTSDQGTLVYITGRFEATERTLVWVDRRGQEEPIQGVSPRAYVGLRLSPDGTQLALATGDQEADIWILELDRETMRRLTFDPSPDTDPVWTPDGERVVFASQRTGTQNLFWKAADGTGVAEQLSQSQYAQVPASVAPDGTRLVLVQESPETNRDIYMLFMDDERRTVPLITAPNNQDSSEVSPDGRWLAYESIESGRDEIVVRPFPDVEDGRWQVSMDGGTSPVWSRDGNELFYLTPDLQIMGTRVEAGQNFVYSTPRLVLEAGAYLTRIGGRSAFDVAPDGERFLMIKQGSAEAGGPGQPQIIVVQSWLSELQHLVPTN